MPALKANLERVGIGLLLCLALLMSLSPLVRLRGPDGDLAGTGREIRSGLTLIRSSLVVLGSYRSSADQGAAYRPVADSDDMQNSLELPLSLENALVTPWLIFAALICAALALVDLLSTKRAVAALSLTGGILAAVAVMHVTLMGSDLRTWTKALISSGSLSTQNSPLFMARLLLVNSFQVNPGAGLYILTACLFLVPFLSYTSGIPRIRSVMRSEPRFDVSQPIRVRPLDSRHVEETCTSVNLSQNGLLVESELSHYYVGMELHVTRNAYPTGPTNPEEHGYVVRVEKPVNGKRRVAIRIISAA